MTENTHSSVRNYLLVFVALGVLTAMTVGVSYLNVSHNTGIFLAALIALVKCCLIAYFFMHLKTESKSIYAILFTALFFVMVLILAIIPDIGVMQ